MPYDINRYRSIPEAFFSLAAAEPERIVYEQALITQSESLSSPRPRISRTYAEVSKRVKVLSSALERMGIGHGDRVAILSGTRPEWLEADLAILARGAVPVSIYQSLPCEAVAYILFDSGSQVVFAENQEQVDKLLEISSREIELPGHEDREPSLRQLHIEHIISLESSSKHPLVSDYSSLLEVGLLEASHNHIEAAPSFISGSDVAAIVYTSGTTGPPKGVLQTHSNHLTNVRQALDSGLVDEDSRLFMLLPLAHSFAKLVAYVGFLSPAVACFPAVCSKSTSRIDSASLSRDMAEANCSVFAVVPRLLEKIREGIVSASLKNTPSGLLLRVVVKQAERHFAEKSSDRVSWIDTLLYSVFRPLRQLLCHKVFGPGFRLAISGGAKLSLDVARFFEALEIEVLEGYGLTETCVATNVNLPGRKKIGSVGPVLAADIEIKVLKDGEVCFRGPNVAIGYYQRPSATAACWEENGWFHTGDFGSLDDDGFLFIRGRKKEIIVTSGGKNIAPQEIEQRIEECSVVGHALMVGDAKKFCVAVISVHSSCDKDKAWKIIDQHIKEKVNPKLASFEQIKGFIIAPHEFAIESGELTPTLKVKRSNVEEKYREQIAELYRTLTFSGV